MWEPSSFVRNSRPPRRIDRVRTMELIRFQNVQMDYGHREVLTDVSFRINEGDKVGLIGPNGAGKTSIARSSPATPRSAVA